MRAPTFRGPPAPRSTVKSAPTPGSAEMTVRKTGERDEEQRCPECFLTRHPGLPFGRPCGRTRSPIGQAAWNARSTALEEQIIQSRISSFLSHSPGQPRRSSILPRFNREGQWHDISKGFWLLSGYGLPFSRAMLHAVFSVLPDLPPVETDFLTRTDNRC